MTASQHDDNRWHLDKKVPISIIVALFIQFLGGVWFMSRLEGRVVALEAAQTSQEKIDDRQDRASAHALDLVRGDIQEIGRKFDRLVERLPPGK